MPLPVIADVARVVLKGTYGTSSQNTVNVIHVQRASSSSTWAQIRDAIANQLADSSNDLMFAPCTSEWSLTEFDLTPLDGTSGTLIRPVGTDSWPVGQAGGDIIPQVCGLLKLTTDQRGRSKRGRLYLGPIGEGVQSSSVLSPTTRDNTTAAWVSFSNGLIGESQPSSMVVASYKLRSAAQITNLACENKTATQRRRNLR